MSTNVRRRFKIKNWLESFLSILLVFSLFTIDIHHHRIKVIQHHEHAVYLAKRRKHLRYVHKWLPVWTARQCPTAKHLSMLTLNHPWQNSVLVLRHNKSTLNPHDWKYDHINFSHKDDLGRVSSPATAYLARANATGDSLRIPQRVKPVGWHQHKYNGDYILNRGHLIAYSLSKDINFRGHYADRTVGNQNDPNNLFTETAFCNQQLQYAFETRIRIALEHNKHIIYRVQPVFRGNELMARGVHLQAISTDKKFQFNVYLFNVQPDVTFNYHTGQAQLDTDFQFKLPNRLIRNSQYLDEHDKDMQWQRKIMHLYKHGMITYQQAYYDESLILGKYIINY